MKKVLGVIVLVLLVAAVVVWMRYRGPQMSVPVRPAEILGTRDVLLYAALDATGLALEIRQRNPDLPSKDPRAAAAMDQIQSLGLRSVEIFVLQSEGKELTAILRAEDPDGNIWKQLNEHPLYKAYLAPEGKNALKPNWEKVPGAESVPEAGKRMQLRSTGNAILGAEAQFLERILRGELMLDKSLAFQMARAVRFPNCLACLSIMPPKELQPGWTEKLSANPAIQGHPMAGMVAGVASELLKEVAALLGSTEALALGFQFHSPSGRHLSYAQYCDSAATAENVARACSAKSDEEKQQAPDGFLSNLLETAGDVNWTQEPKQTGRLFTLDLRWEGEADREVRQALAQATLGYVLSKSMSGHFGGMKPSEGPIQTHYIRLPEFKKEVARSELEGEVARQLQARLFPGHYWEQGEEPQMTLELDALDVPNKELSEGEYEVLSVKAEGGREVVRRGGTQASSSLNFSSGQPYTNINIPVEKGTPGESLRSATVKFIIRTPVSVEIIRFKAGEAGGTKKKSGKVTVTLNQLEKDIADVTVKGSMEKANLFALEASGRAIGRHFWMGGAGSSSAQFRGIIDELLVVIPGRMAEVTQTLEVNLNGGKSLELSDQPSPDVRVRYEPAEEKTYRSVTESELAGSEVKWIKDEQNPQLSGLALDLPEGANLLSMSWETHWFASDRPVLLSGGGFGAGSQLVWRAQEGLRDAAAVFGNAKFALAGTIRTCALQKTEDEAWSEEDLGGGKTVKARFRHNHITYSVPGLQVLDMSGRDTQGRRLKMDFWTYSDQEGTTRRLWGQPAKFEMAVAMDRIEKSVPFEIVRGEINKDAFSRYKTQVADQREVSSVLRQIGQVVNRNWNGYGEDAAGLFYLHGKEAKAGKLIPEEWAHACPEGAERFRYKAVPFRGYFFSFASGGMQGGVLKPYARGEQERDFVWDGGKLSVKPLQDRPGLVAWPEGAGQPTLILYWGNVYMKDLAGKRLEALPENIWNEGWIQVE